MGMDFRADNVAPAIKEALKEGFSPGDIAEELFRQQRADENYSIGECKNCLECGFGNVARRINGRGYYIGRDSGKRGDKYGFKKI